MNKTEPLKENLEEDKKNYLTKTEPFNSKLQEYFKNKHKIYSFSKI